MSSTKVRHAAHTELQNMRSGPDVEHAVLQRRLDNLVEGREWCPVEHHISLSGHVQLEHVPAGHPLVHVPIPPCRQMDHPVCLGDASQRSAFGAQI